MINKLTKMLERLLLVAVILGLICYFAVVCFYKDVFMINTWINGIYCTGKSVEEVNTELLLQTKAPFLTIINRDGETGIIDMAEVAYQEDYTVSLQAQKENQNPWLWPIELGKKKNISLLPQRTWDEGALKLLVTELDIVKKEISDVLMVKIIKGDAGYELYDNLYDVLQPELLAEYVNQCFVLGEMTVQMQLSDAYRDMPASAVQEETRKQWEQLQEYLDCGIVYDMGAEKIAIDHKIASEFVLVDEDGRFILDEHGGFQLDELAVELFIDRLAMEYNTVDSMLEFNATRGETVQVEYVTYGTELDAEAEKTYLKEAFSQGIREEHVPTYLQEGYVRGKNDIGDTYIEVDMGIQKLYAYKNGELLLETDIVTGNMKRKWNTPEGVNFVYNKQKNRTLRGPGYATPVDFWMPVKGSIGLHDADWRKEFGGEIYMTNGSHGCVNIPPEVMPTIYDEYEIGTPVIMFY
ncbi:MAG: L,D-transpeptidase [Lachnospiraceae bacterium]|nr:L,D-transpeptidase [Lachnospiraceae bacterium]